MKKRVLVSLLVASSLFASSNGDFNDGINLFNSGNYKDAYDKFNQAFKSDKSNPQISFYLGRSAYELGLYDKSLVAYERVLIHDENHIRTKLEVGRVYLMLKMFEEAKTEFYEVLDSNPPESVKENVQKILTSLEKLEERNFLNYSATAGIGYDTNINMNPGSEVLLDYLASSNPNLDKDGFKADDEIDASFLQEALSVNHIYDLGERGGFYLDNSVNLYNQNYKSNKEYDVFYTSANVGLGYLKEDYKFVIPLIYDKIVYGRSSLLDSISIAPKFSKQIFKTLSFNTFFKFQRKMYNKNEDKGRESDVKEAGIGFTKSIDTHYFDVSYSFLNENKTKSNSDSNSNFINKDLYNLKLSYFKNIDDLFNLNLQYNFRKSLYDDVISDIDAKREDNYKSYLVGASKDLSKSTSLLFSYNLIDNNSNYTPIMYDKSIYSLNLNINF